MRTGAVTASFSYVPNEASTSRATETTVSSGLQFLCFPIHYREKCFYPRLGVRAFPSLVQVLFVSTLADLRRSRQRSRESHHAKQLPSLVNRSNGTPLFIGVQSCRYGLFANNLRLDTGTSTRWRLSGIACALYSFAPHSFNRGPSGPMRGPSSETFWDQSN
jgi:hypothetical protein